MTERIYPLNFAPGIQRDGTVFASRHWTDGQWCRFQRGLPQKMGGYVEVYSSTTGVPRGTFVIGINPNFNFYYGTGSHLQYITIDQFGTLVSGAQDRTPLFFSANPNNDWQFDTMFSTTDDTGLLIAHAAPNLAAIDSDVERPVYYGSETATTPLLNTGINVSGGIVVLHPFLFAFGNNGQVIITNANDPTTVMNTARVTASKIVTGFATRGGTASPAGLLWSLDSVIRVTQVGTNEILFNFDTITNDSSMLSSRGVVEYDGKYFWCGVDRFLFYNGVVDEIQNNMSINFFFRNVNYQQRQKVWGTKVTQYGEIWWFFPRGDATECNWAVVYNIREGYWYDTPITRSDGYYDQTFSKPIWADNTPDGAGHYPIWIHETGYDSVNINGVPSAILSYITTPTLSWLAIPPSGERASLDRNIELYRLELDMLQQQQMSMTVSGLQYARSNNIVVSAPYVYQPTDVKIDARDQRREMFLTFTSNAVGGYYEFGQNLIVGRIGDERQ